MLFYSLFFYLAISNVVCFRCDRRPYGSNTEASEPDGRFKMVIDGLKSNAYIPGQLYTVRITATDDESTFTSFMISVEGDTKRDPNNPRRMILLDPGELRPMSSDTAKFSDRCPYSVEQTMISFKSSVEVYWQAPASGNGCISLRAMVAENEAVWFEDGAPLTKKLCEDMRQPDDVPSQINMNCQICDEAKYEISFTGIWSKNTHPYLFPENDWVPKYSDLVGASHSIAYTMWALGGMASPGLKDLAEHANTSALETEMREKVGDGVRTIIKGKGHASHKMNRTTYSFFRVNQENHLFSVAVGIFPSPDWFLGVNRFELCQEDNTWLQERELDLYPWDAGTDSGISYESPNSLTFPPDTISRVQMSSYDKNSPFYRMNIDDMHPFGKFHIKLIRTYPRECPEETTEETTTEGEEGGEEVSGEEEPKKDEGSTEDENKSEPQAPSRYHTEIGSSEDGGETSDEEDVTEPAIDCPMTDWQRWSECDGDCVDGKLAGYKWRERYHLVDGVPVEKYDPLARHSPHKKPPVPTYCKTHFDTFEKLECEEECTEPVTETEDELQAERRVAGINLGSPWFNRRQN